MNHSVAGIATQNGKIFVGLRAPKGEMGNRWEFPGGKVESKENYETALRREFLEEFACDIQIGRAIDVQFFEHAGCAVTLHAYEITLPSNPVVASDEHSSCTWKTMAEIKALPFVDSDIQLFPAVERYLEGGVSFAEYSQKLPPKESYPE